eukprot:TRINITY_DN15855_c0_g1_i1.p1 TRINITY_DN15855_c0_g1~~TRINITY_DN15855_c0_g1_i1.p1  ORF type:complete len:277 (+),score=37.73 TRINITY_DN15855_c0_g1_i1:69-899(+)
MNVWTDFGYTSRQMDQFKSLLEVEVPKKVKVKLTADVYNLYYLTLLKKWHHGSKLERVHCEFPNFLINCGVGGWPWWCFVLELAICTFAVKSAYQAPWSFCMTSWANWFMLITANMLNKFFVAQRSSECQILVFLHREASALEPDRRRALSWIIVAKFIETMYLFVATTLIIFTKTKTDDMLRSYAAMSFVNTLPSLYYHAMNRRRTRKQLGLKSGVLFGYGESPVDLFDFSLDVELNTRHDGKGLWIVSHAINIIYYLSLIVAFARSPLINSLHA